MRTLLLDHDDVLVLSEALVFKASCPLINEVVQRNGVNYTYTPYELREKFAGLGFTRIVRALGCQHCFEITSEELQELSLQELNLVVEVLQSEAVSSPGVIDMLNQMYQWGIICAIVSSSELRRIDACMQRTGLDQFIAKENVFSAADSLPKPEPKPSSAVYDFAVKSLRVSPKQCLAVEDSPTGVLAAVQAKIEVVGYVGAEKSPDDQAKRSRALLEAGATATFSDWKSFQEWVSPRITGMC